MRRRKGKKGLWKAEGLSERAILRENSFVFGMMEDKKKKEVPPEGNTTHNDFFKMRSTISKPTWKEMYTQHTIKT